MAAKKRKKKNNNLSYFIVLLVVAAIVIIFKFDYSDNETISAFETNIPKQYNICGIDVSRYQGKINWASVARACSGKDSLKISFAYIKASEGWSIKDPCYSYNWENTKKNNIIRGAYHYYKPNVNSKLQANNFISVVKMEKGDLPPVLDIEETGRLGNENMRKGIKNWLTIIEKQYGVKPIIYCYVDFYENYLSDDEFKSYPFWIAHYYESKLRVKDKWMFWQYSDKGKVNGITNNVDFNVFNGSMVELRKLCKSNDI